MECPHMRKELDELMATYKFRVPDRGTSIEDDTVKWRTCKPNYTKADLAFLKGKTMNHAAGSLEELVENLVKTWEMEASHKVDLDQWTTVNQEHYVLTANGNPDIPGEEAKEMGNYNALMVGCPAKLWPQNLDFEKSHNAFRNAFTAGFGWEVLSVFSGPPHVVFTWRHWAHFVGVYTAYDGLVNQGNGELVEMYGSARVTVDKELKICKIDIFYKPDEFLEVMRGERSPEELRGQCLVGPRKSVLENLQES